MDSPLSDDPNGEHYDFNALINDQVKNRFEKKQFFFRSIQYEFSHFRIH